MQLLLSVDGIITSGLNSNSRSAIPVRIVPPYSSSQTFFIQAAESGKRLENVLFERFPYKPFSFWKGRILENAIRTSGGIARVLPGDCITHFRENIVEPSVPDLVCRLENTAEWSVWFKPAPLPVHSGGRYHKNTLLSIVEETVKHAGFPVHRLDAVTSGLVLIAHSTEASSLIGRAFSAQTAKKVYLAVVSGTPPDEYWTVSRPVRRKKGFVFELHDAGQPAETRFNRLWSGAGRSVIACFPVTGRTHQIRLHLRYSGFPVIDDPVYGSHIEEPDDLVLQNRAISLVHAGISIPESGIRAIIPGLEEVISPLL